MFRYNWKKCQKNCKVFRKRYKISISTVMCTAEILHIVDILLLLKCMILQKHICAHAHADIFYSLHVNEKG